jgi:hypothetical protein
MLEEWKEKHDKPLMAPYNNETIKGWRDDPRALDSADFDPVLLGNQRE